MKINRTAVPLLCAIMLSGCNTGDTVSRSEYDKLKAQYDELAAAAITQAETTAPAPDKSAAESAAKSLRAENAELKANNEMLEQRLAEYASSDVTAEETPAYTPVTIYKGNGAAVQYLGDEPGENGERIIVLRCQLLPDYAFLRIDTNKSELHNGLYIREGQFEFANENIDEDGYLYLINNEYNIDEFYSDRTIPFTAEKYIKLRLRDLFTDELLPYDDTDSTYIFVGDLAAEEIFVGLDGEIQNNIVTEEITHGIIGAAQRMKFEEELYNYDTNMTGR